MPVEDFTEDDPPSQGATPKDGNVLSPYGIFAYMATRVPVIVHTSGDWLGVNDIACTCFTAEHQVM